MWRLSFDRPTGRLWAADVGQDLFEEIDVIAGGGNYGWKVREGKHWFDRKAPSAGTDLIDPVWEYPHSVGKSVTGGLVYRGQRVPALAGAYLYGDWVTGLIWALRYDGQRATGNELIARTRVQVSSFGQDEVGEAYITGYDGSIYQLRPAPVERLPSPDFPRKLTETKLFTSVERMQPAVGFIPYSVNVPLWSDHAAKERFIALPESRQVIFHERDKWQFPVGTVFAKTFLLDLTRGDPSTRRRLETRLLVRNRRAWEGYTYVWNDEQTDATLIDSAVTRTFEVRSGDKIEKQTWYFPSRMDCIVCHTKAADFVLGWNTRQLNRVHNYGGQRENQLKVFDRLGLFDRPLPKSLEQLEAFQDWEAPQPDAARLARPYLDVNCAFCHTPGGTGGSRADMRFHTPLAEMMLVGHPPAQGRLGPRDSLLVAPGAPHRSELLTRMKRRGGGQMPTLATTLVDKRAVAVITKWIESLPQQTAHAREEAALPSARGR